MNWVSRLMSSEGWAMSNDYAAIATTVIFGVLVIGTAQHYAMVKRINDLRNKRIQTVSDARARALNDLRNGTKPSLSDLEQAHGSHLTHEGLDGGLTRWSAGLWGIVAGSLAVAQVRILIWAGGADPGPAPNLAHLIFINTAGAIALLVLETFARAGKHLITNKPPVRTPWPGNNDERAQLVRIVREHQETHQVPHPQPDTGTQTTSSPDSSPT
ncbi:hypothetical protein ACF09C_24525 [Streptomyces sp. NPDC014870]|uniref:hypothetical protein n=1 Tax=Streptomyces sp. NPDC014870 TaxID=3364925 RepID=UPI0036F7F344